MPDYPALQPGQKITHSVTETWVCEGVPVVNPDHPPVVPPVTPPPPLRVPGTDDGYAPVTAAGLSFPPPGPGDRDQKLWGLRVDPLAVHKLNDQWMGTIGAGNGRTMKLQNDFSGAPDYFGIPINIAPQDTPLRPVRITGWPDESDMRVAGYPIPDRAWVESGSDKHLLVYQNQYTDAVARWLLYEFQRFRIENGEYVADCVAIWDLTTGANRPPTWSSADAAGCPLAPPLVRWAEVSSGSIRHALRCTVFSTSHEWLAPAGHEAGRNPLAPPMGARLRLKAGVDLSRFSVPVRVIGQCMKEHGMVVVDNSTDTQNVYITGEPAPNWSNQQLHDELNQLLFPRDFEFVDAAGAPAS